MIVVIGSMHDLLLSPSNILMRDLLETLWRLDEWILCSFGQLSGCNNLSMCTFERVDISRDNGIDLNFFPFRFQRPAICPMKSSCWPLNLSNSLAMRPFLQLRFPVSIILLIHMNGTRRREKRKYGAGQFSVITPRSRVISVLEI